MKGFSSDENPYDRILPAVLAEIKEVYLLVADFIDKSRSYVFVF